MFYFKVPRFYNFGGSHRHILLLLSIKKYACGYSVFKTVVAVHYTLGAFTDLQPLHVIIISRIAERHLGSLNFCESQ